MKKLLYILPLFLLLLTGCNNQIQEQFNNQSIYIIQNDYPILLKYIQNDSSLKEREKEPFRDRKQSIDKLIQKIKVK